VRDVRVLLAQTSPALGDVARNLEQHLEAITAAKKARARLVVMPELSLTGYFLNDLTDEVALPRGHRILERLVAATRGLALAFGFVERAPDQRLYNACAFAEGGRLLHVHRKVHLPTYGIFDEARYLAPGTGFRAFDASFGRVGILVCEDAWHLASAYLHFLQDVDLLLVTSASPGRGLTARGEVSATRSWDAILEAQAALFQVFVVYCNRVGVEDGITFFGGSRVLDPFGTPLVRIDGIEPSRAVASLDGGALRRARLFAPMRRDERPEIVLRELGRILGEAP
jgi:predicted amidohydrolase